MDRQKNSYLIVDATRRLACSREWGGWAAAEPTNPGADGTCVDGQFNKQSSIVSLGLSLTRQNITIERYACFVYSLICPPELTQHTKYARPTDHGMSHTHTHLDSRWKTFDIYLDGDPERRRNSLPLSFQRYFHGVVSFSRLRLKRHR